MYTKYENANNIGQYFSIYTISITNSLKIVRIDFGEKSDLNFFKNSLGLTVKLAAFSIIVSC